MATFFAVVFISNQRISEGSNCFSRGSVPVLLREHIATCDLPGGVPGPLSPPSGSAYVVEANFK